LFDAPAKPKFMIENDPARFYTDGAYERLNPSWDTADSAWKAALILALLKRRNMKPQTVLEVGCGSGAVLASLKTALPTVQLSGWDIAAGVERFWVQYPGITFSRGDLLDTVPSAVDLLLLLDVIEHVANPHDFLSRLRPHGQRLLMHIPLDLSVASVLRETPLLQQRRGVGHIHYFTRGLALDLLAECGYEVLDVSFTGAHTRASHSWGGRLASLARRSVFALNRPVGVRLLGGDTLLVLARPRAITF
jgi:SAM-dependent methyltransferase